MNENKRLVRELTALYTLEESLKDIYVEGPLDKCVYDNFISINRIGVKSVLIDSVDFTDTESKYLQSLDLTSNKDKTILLSRILVNVKTKSKVVCVADKDLDSYSTTLEVNTFLWRTDFSCLEAYYFDEDILNRFTSFCFQNMSVKCDNILKELESILKLYFSIRIARLETNPSLKLPEITKMVSITRKGVVTFDKQNIVDTFLNNNRVKKGDKEGVIQSIEKAALKIANEDIRNVMNGHDFVDLLLYYFNCTKNTNNFKESNFHRTMLMSAEASQLEKFNLFQRLKAM